uniref:TIL domain-containing protein n=1 Tax=Acrobeloides nanus TaxID=290746 RepID=A0A914D0L1_9BILA
MGTLAPFTLACLLFFLCISFNHSFKLTEKESAADDNVSHKLSDYFKDYFESVNNTLAEDLQHRRVKRCGCKMNDTQAEDLRHRRVKRCGCEDTCPINERWEECDKCGEGTCDEPRVLCSKRCKSINKCVCNHGYVRHNGRCIQTEACPGNCGDNEHWNGCGGCEGTCDNKSPNCITMCMPGKCVCNQGYVRHNGRCIQTVSCPDCGDNEHWNGCGGCEGTCGNKSPNCHDLCMLGKCVCNHGYVRHYGSCIRRLSCPA